MESQPQNPEFRINPENLHPCVYGSREDFDESKHLARLVRAFAAGLWDKFENLDNFKINQISYFNLPNSAF